MYGDAWIRAFVNGAVCSHEGTLEMTHGNLYIVDYVSI